MIYGTFSVLCQSIGILLLLSMHENVIGDFYFHRYFPMIEHSLVSFIAILVGVVGLEYLAKAKQTD
jgi:uncharacterized membrane protein